MKVSFIIPSMTKGGAERVIANLSNYFVSQGISVDIITLYHTDVGYELDSNVQLLTVDSHFTDSHELEHNYVGFRKLIHYVKKIFLNRKRKKALLKIVQESSSDVYLSFLPNPSFLLLKLRKYVKAPIIVSVRNDPKVEYRSFYHKYMMKKLYPKADGFVFQTEDAQKYFHDFLSCPSVIIPNPVNAKFIRPSFSGKRKKEIVTVGRLVEQKNHKLLIDSFLQISSKFPDYTLRIFGDGYLKESLIQYVKEKGYSDKILFLGNKSLIEEEIYESALFVLSSSYEGLPNALIEAMCLGLPVISTDCPCGGPKSLIQNHVNGILVSVNHTEELAVAMERVLSDSNYSSSLGEKATLLKDKVAPTIVNEAWLNFIKKFLR